jgi:hypothetical protein
MNKTEQFIIKSKKVHEELYDYSKVVYENNSKEVIIICKIHGEFLQLPKTHKRGSGCKRCGIERTINHTQSNKFVEKANLVHNYIYDYSKTNYKNAKEKIIIICKYHGEFMINPNSHLCGTGCRSCNIMKKNKSRKTKEQFIEEATKMHSDRYDYSKINYIDYNQNILIICKEHGEFEQSPNIHLHSKGCYECSILSKSLKKTKTTEQFVEEAKEKHGDIFDYSKTIYRNYDKKIIIICKEHGEFQHTPGYHLSGKGCNKCGILIRTNKITSNTSEFIEKANKVHKNLYDYSKVEYKRVCENIIIICKEHGEFRQTPNVHLSGAGCKSCGTLHMKHKMSYNNTEFIEKANHVHINRYDYSKVEYNNVNTKIIIICKKHGEFQQTPQGHLSGRGCIKCAKCGWSKAQIKYLDFISKYENIFIHHALNSIEYKIPNTNYKCDGYCKETNTVYEFHGDLWHGNPKVYNPSNISYFGISYGELYQNTLEREKNIHELGYNLVIMWEHDWKKINRVIKIFQKIYRLKNKK